MGPMLWNVVRLVAAVVAALAIVVQSSAVANGVDEWDPSHFYANFTIQSSLIGIVVLVWAFRRRNSAPGGPHLAGQLAVGLDPRAGSAAPRGTQAAGPRRAAEMGAALTSIGAALGAQSTPDALDSRFAPS